MKLIKNDQPDIAQLRVLLKTTTKNALGDHLYLGSGRNPAIKADLVAHSITDLFLAELAHVFRCQPGRNPTGLKQEDLLFVQPGGVF